MITLCGFALSNYYNKVKLVLLEKQIPFVEERVSTGSADEAVLAATPLGKVPFIRCEHGSLCESEVIVDYLEAAYPQPALRPADPWAQAKAREITTFVELHLELVARELYGKAFFDGSISEGRQEHIRKQLLRNAAAFKRLAVFGPYVAGDTFTTADCAAYVSLPLVSMACKAIYGTDLLLEAGVDWKTYVRFVGQRPSAQRVDSDRKAEVEARAAAAKAAP